MRVISTDEIQEVCEKLFDSDERELVNLRGDVRKVSRDGFYVKFFPVPENEDWVVFTTSGEDLSAGLSIQIPSSPSPPDGDESGTDYIDLHSQWIRHDGMAGHDGQIGESWYPTEEQIEALRHYLEALRITAPDEFKPHEQPPSEVLAWSKVKWLEGILEKVKVHQ